MVYTILVIIFLLLMGSVISGTFAERSFRGDRPPIYDDENFMGLINLLWIPMVIVFIILLFLDWKVTLIIGVISWLLGGRILKKMSEFIIVLPLYNLLIRKK